MKIKTILLTAAALFVGAAIAGADERSSAILDRISASLKAYGDYEVRFTVSAEGMDDIAGYYIVSGDRYRINVGSEEHIGDGKVRYEISHNNMEVIIDNADPGGNNIFTNPSRAFEFAGDQFRSEWLRSETLRGVQCDVIMLHPLNQAYGNMAITLRVDQAACLPVSVEYDYDGGTVSIAISEIRKSVAADRSLFTFDPADYPGHEIIDFR
jgi:outer membrane lipoprotein-sorting protein